MRERVMVTGGAGFIGSHVVDRLLADGHRVLVVDDFSTGRRENLAAHAGDPRLVVVEADVAGDLEAALAHPLDGDPITRVVHLAAQVSVVVSVERPEEDVRVNILGTLGVLAVARAQGARQVVFASSAAVYGDVDVVPTPEDAPTRPIAPYGIDKLASEHFLRFYAANHGVPTRPLRFFNVYGPRQDPRSPYTGVISIFLDRALAGQTLTIFGDGAQTRDFVFVRDLVDAIVRATFGAPGDGAPINVGTGSTVSVTELARAAVEVTGSSSSIAFGPTRPGDIQRSCAVVARAKRELGFEATTALRDGLAETVAWVRRPPTPS